MHIKDGKLQCPYDELTLKIALLSVANKLEAYSAKHGEDATLLKVDEVLATYGAPDSAEFTTTMAKHYAVTAESLINSPNYKQLKEDFIGSSLSAVFTKLKQEFEFNDKETWAIILGNELT